MSPLADHYRTLVESRGYEDADFALGGLPASTVRRLFACSDEGRRFAAASDAGERSLVTVGVSMTGPPHVGTLGQLQTAVQLQDAGFDVQLVLADLAAYNAAGRDLAEVRALARRYRSFALDLGFDAEAGVLRSQEEATDVLHTSQLLSRHFDPDSGDDEDGSGPTAFERELAEAYENTDAAGAKTTRFAGQQVALSLVSDTVHWAIADDYENLLFVGGADNHGLTGFFRDVLAGTPYDAAIAGLYTRLVPGLAGVPKMSKSIPRSRVALADDPATLRAAVADAAETTVVGDSTVLSMMRLASPYSEAEFAERREAFDAGGEAWADAKREYAEYLVDVASAWKRTC